MVIRMKQLIVLSASVILGIIIVECILGDGGILDSMKNLWNEQMNIRNMHFVSI